VSLQVVTWEDIEKISLRHLRHSWRPSLPPRFGCLLSVYGDVLLRCIPLKWFVEAGPCCGAAVLGINRSYRCGYIFRL